MKGDIKRMETVISFTPAQLVAFIGSIAGVCAGLATITGFIVAIIKRLKAPEQEQNARIEKLEKKYAELEKRLDEGETRFDRIEESTKITLETLRALLKHSLGGDLKDLQDAEKKLDDYLTAKAVKQ